MLHFVRRDIFAYAKVIFRLLRPWRSGILFAHTAAAGNITRRNRISQHRNNTRCRRIELKKALASASAFFWLLRTVMMHPAFGISYFVRLGAFRDMPHFVRRDIFACAKGILRLWRSGILFAHTTAVGNSTRRSRISLRSNRTRVRRE